MPASRSAAAALLDQSRITGWKRIPGRRAAWNCGVVHSSGPLCNLHVPSAAIRRLGCAIGQVAGGDDISDAGLIAVGQEHLGCRLGVIKTMRPGTAVEFGDKLAAGGEHDGVKAGRSIDDASGERILGGGGNVADVDSIVIEIEVERRRCAFAEGE